MATSDVWGFSRYPLTTAGEDLAAKLKPYFGIGDQSKNVQLSPFYRTNYSNQDLPDAYIGRNTTMEARMQDFIVHEDNDFYTTRILPWRYTDQIHHQTNEYHFNVVFPGRVPHEGVSRLVSFNREARMAHSKRYGLAFYLENDFYMTPQGREDYLNNIRGIGCCVQEGANHDVIAQLLTCKNREKEFQERFGTVPFRLDKMMIVEVENFGCLAKNVNRLDMVIEENRKVMQKRRVTPDTLIISQGGGVFMRFAEGEQTKFMNMGPGKQQEIDNGPSSLGTYARLSVFETRSFDIYTDAPAVDLLTRRRQIGEYNLMSFKRFRGRSDIYDYTSAWRDIYIYNSNKDDMEKISFLTALRRSGLFDPISGAWTKTVNDLQGELYHPTNTGSYDPSEIDFDDDGVHRKVRHGEDIIPFFLSENVNGKRVLIERFGQFPLNAASAKDFEHIGQTLIKEMTMDHKTALSRYNEGKRLLENIESEKYDEKFFYALIQKNFPNSARDTTFVGHQTPADVAGQWVTEQIQEWTPNAFGGLDLPDRWVDADHTVLRFDCQYPPGFANAPGLRTIVAHENNDKSGWKELALQVRPFLHVINVLCESLQAVIPESYLLSVRRPWFHTPSALTALFNEAISVPRAPIFLAVPNAGVGSGDDVYPDVATQGSQIETVWTLDYVTPGTESADKIREDIINLLKGKTPEARAQEGKGATHYVFHTPGASGTTTKLPTQVAEEYAAVSRDLRAYLLLGEKSAAAYKSILEKLTRVQPVERESRENLLDFIFYFGATDGDSTDRNTMRLAVLALARYERNDELRSALSKLAVNGNSGAGRIKAARKLMEQLAENEKTAPNGVQEDKDVDSKAQPGLGIITLLKKAGGAPAPPITSSSINRNGQLFSQLIQNIDEVDQIRKTAGVRSPAVFDLGEVPSKSAWLNTKINSDSPQAQAHNELVKQIKAIVVQMQRNSGPGQSLVGARTEVHTDKPETIEIKNWFRAPLTMSLELLSTSATQPTPPLILPGDPDQDYLVPWVPTHDRIVPSRIVNSPDYAPLDTSIAAGESFEGRQLLNASFIKMHTPLGASHEDFLAAPSYTSGSKRKAAASSDFYAGESAEKYAASSSYSGLSSGTRGIGALPLEEEESWERSATVREPDEDLWTLARQRTHDAPGARPKRRALRGGNAAAAAKYEMLTGVAFTKRWRDANQIANPLVRVAVMAFLAAPCDNGRWWERLIKNDIHVPINIILWRIRITYMMSTFIMIVAGIETGATLFGHAYFDMGQDVATKMILGNFTFYSTAWVYREENVQELADVFAQSYEGGSNCGFIKDGAELRNRQEDIDMPSIIASVVPIAEENFTDLLSITGELPFADANNTLDPNITRKCYSTYQLTDKIFNLSGLYGTRDPGSENFLDQADRPNILAFPGLQFDYSPATHLYDVVSEGTGHRKGGVGRGTKDIWNRKVQLFPTQNWASYHLP